MSGPKTARAGDVIEAHGALWIVGRVSAKEVTALRLANGELKHPRTFGARQIDGVWRRIGRHPGRG